MSRQALLIEERLRVVLAYLDALQQKASLIDDEPAYVPPVVSPGQFARWVSHMASVMSGHVIAVSAALPATCNSLEAPDKRAGES